MTLLKVLAVLKAVTAIGVGLFLVTLIVVVAAILDGSLFYSGGAKDIWIEGDPPLDVTGFRPPPVLTE